MELKEDLKNAISKADERFDGVEEVTVEQREEIDTSMQRKDVFAVLPTGYGKSLLFQLIPGVCLELCNMGYANNIGRYKIHYLAYRTNAGTGFQKLQVNTKHGLHFRSCCSTTPAESYNTKEPSQTSMLEKVALSLKINRIRKTDAQEVNTKHVVKAACP